MSGTGNIYDLQSETREITLRFRAGVRYAVVLPSYYNARPVYAKTAERACALAAKESRNGYHGVRIVADDGTILDPFAGFLVDTGNRFPGKKNR